MRRFIIFVLLVIGFFYWASNFVKSDKLQNFIDTNSEKQWAAKAQFYLGRIYQATAKLEKAEFCFNRVIEKYKNSEYYVDAIYQLGTIYEDTKRFSQAKEIYKKIVDQYPNYSKIQLVKNKLDFLTNY